MIDLHYWPTPNGKKVTILLEELGMPYKIVPVNIGRGDQFTPEFLEMNPNHRMPVMVDHAPKGVRVNCVSPGPVLTPLMRRNRTPDEIAMIGQGSLLGRVANPEELADAIVYLASDQASYVVGQTLPVNGGAAARV